MPTEVSLGLVLAALGWVGYCFREWKEFEFKARTELDSYDQSQTGVQAEILRQVMGFGLRNLVDLYFTVGEQPTVPTLTSTQLRDAAERMDADAAAAGLRFAMDVSRPVAVSLITAFTTGAGNLWVQLATTEDVANGLMTLRCYSTEYGALEKRITRLSTRYVVQMVVLFGWIAAVLLGFTFAPDALGVPVLLAVVPVSHGALLEISRHRLDKLLRSPRVASS